MAAAKPFSFNGNLKGEILLANGSRVLFDAPKWEFSYPTMHNSGYCTIKAEECPDQAGIHIDGKQFAQKIRDMQSQSIKINVELTEEGKRMLKDTVLGKVKSEHSKPPVGSWDDWDKRVRTQHELLEEMYKVLLEYVETFPREIELRDRAYPLINRVYENLKEWADNALASEKELSKKTHGIPRDPLWEIVKELVDRDFAAPYEVMGRNPCPFCKGVNDGISNFHHESTCGIAQLRRLVWYKQETETAKKQEESTALFDVIGKAVLEHSAKSFWAQNSDDTARVQYHAGLNTWDLTTATSSSRAKDMVITKDKLQTFADETGIDLSKGWRLFSVSGMRG